MSELPALHPTEKALRNIESIRDSFDDKKEELEDSHHIGSDLDDFFTLLDSRLESVQKELEESVDRLGEGPINAKVLIRLFQRLEREIGDIPDVELRDFMREFIDGIINDCDISSSNEELKKRLLK